MPSVLPVLRPTEIIRVLERFGFRFVSQRGSHQKYTDGKHVVIIPMHDTVAKGTLRSILTMADISAEEFLEQLN